MNEYILECKNISKSFSGVEVLKNINIKIKKGEIHAIMGANGAGKSTLMKIICGVHRANGGELLYMGKKEDFKSPLEAQKKGISIIYQELSLIPTLKNYENLFVGNEIRKNGFFTDDKKMIEKFKLLCENLNFDIDPLEITKNMSISKQQMIEILKAINNESDIIIMDEPTTSLSEKEKQSLFEIIKKLKNSGKTIIYISHMLEEVFSVCERISVLRDGEFIITEEIKNLTKDKVVEYMTGKPVRKVVQKNKKENLNEVILSVKNLTYKNILKNVSFDLRKGEILGIAGLVGAGRTELSECIFGVKNKDSGEIFIENKKIDIKHPKDAVKNGIGLIPEDRKNYGLILKHTIKNNSTIIQIEKMLNNNFISNKKENEHIEKAIKDLSIKVSDYELKVSSLSGGNQQKIVVSKWNDMDLKVLIFDEPTKGIDVNAKEDIFKIIEDYSSKGMGIIFISSDLEEVERISDRVLVLKKGNFIKELKDNELTIKNINNYVLNG
ncbi:sugar ABC transporter ATP-binding protein [Fusobacterium perfoetens]|uniref:sugar ABC transporter ATP-binding protein n=1 Tax=Fusobacterium perfoetens TaxID=852 RepID=UPI000485E1BF|nr:sugar ABC transporter ATP-binding protein [Fusobacterium perfoetens]MCI6152187.1 sugar ABC transporter ATP-binding protein [Fusobacterium perfoetens]MDY3237922.1 sugar ABC transporter ATP-binding protein [Fusobacterium perfoetens]